MSEVWIVIVEDRHADVGVSAHGSEASAVSAARRAAEENVAASAVEEQELNAAMRRDGWVFLAKYGGEGDCVRVVKRLVGD